MRIGARALAALPAVLLAILVGWTAAVQGQTRPYTIGPQDILLVTVFNQADLTGRFPVAADGTLSFPYIGRVKAAGLTARELEITLTSKLTDGNYLKNPLVTVSVEAFRSQQVFVIGEVRQPNTYFLSGNETLIQVLARAGSPTADAGSEVMIVRPRSHAPTSGPVRPDQAQANEILKVDLQKLAAGAMENNLDVQDGDTIFVPRAEPIYILGQVRNPGPYRLTTRTLTVRQLISMAGGITERGAMNRTQVIRGGKKAVKIGLDDLVQPNDTIVVPEKFWLP